MAFKNFSEVKEWIEDNKLVKYQFATGRMTAENKGENNLIFNYDQDESPEENMRLLEKRLEAHAGQRLLGRGWRTMGALVGGFSCEVQYNNPSYMQQFQGMIGAPQAAYDKEEMVRDITEKLETRMRLQQLESERKNFERERKEFEDEKRSAIGAIIGYFAPVAQAWMAKQGLAKVAGADVEAERITPVDAAPEQAPEEELTEDEQDKAYNLLLRFRKVEPDYLQLLESVVKMAENGDAMYTTAKSFLCKS